MKKNKWFILAAMIGLIMSVGFLVTSCELLEEIFSCSGSSCSSADLSRGCSSADYSSCGRGLSGMNCSGVKCK